MKKDFSLARLKRAFYYRIYRRALRAWLKTLVSYDDFQARRRGSVSFRSLMAKESQREALSSLSAAKLLESKEVGAKFAASNDIPTPPSEVYWNSEDVLTCLKKSNTSQVVKPLVGCSCNDVFICYHLDDIFDLGQKRKLQNFDELKTKLETSTSNGWIVEAFLASIQDERCPAHDLKFYSFYGEVGMVKEVRRHPEVRFCYWGSDGQNIGKGQRNYPLFPSSEAYGFSEQDKALVQKLSLEIPVPFIRIDFLKSNKGTFFGEFTPVPGNLHHSPYEIDKHLGKLYLEAESRLLRDLWNGKSFETFRKATSRA